MLISYQKLDVLTMETKILMDIPYLCNIFCFGHTTLLSLNIEPRIT